MALDHATHATHAALVPPPRPRQMPGVFAVALFVAFFLVLGGIVLKNISKVPFDVTLAGALLLGALAAIDWVRKCYPTRQMAPILLLVVVGVLQIIVRGESGPFSQDQMVKFLGLTVPLILAAGILLSSRASLVILNWAFFAVSVIAAGFSAADGFGRFDELGRATLGGSETGGVLGYYSAVGFLVCMGRLVGSRSEAFHGKTFWVWMLGLPAFGFLTLASGARGAVLGVGVGVAVILICTPGRSRLKLVLFACALAPVFVALWQFVNEGAKSRLFLGDPAREYVWQASWNTFLQNPLFGASATGVEKAVYPLNYPHNLLLEVAAMWGIVALLLLLWAYARGFGGVWSGRRDREAVLAGGLLTLFLCQSMVSLDINNRVMWVVLVACVLVPVWMRGESLSRASKSLGIEPGRNRESPLLSQADD